MLDSAPKPLPRKRLERIIRGLGVRTTSSAQQMAQQIVSLKEELQTLEQKHTADIQVRSTKLRGLRQRSTTDWDVAIHQAWDAAEGTTYAAVYETAAQDKSLNKAAKAETDKTLAEATRRSTETEERFQKAKEKPLRQQRAFRDQIQALSNNLVELVNKAESALNQRSLRVPQFELEPIAPPQATSARDAFVEVQNSVGAARKHCERLTDHPLAKFVESSWWWMFNMLVFFGITAGTLLTGALDLVPAIVTGSVVSISLLVLGVLGVRPWLKRVARAEYPMLQQHKSIGAVRAEYAQKLMSSEVNDEIQRLESARDKQLTQIQDWRTSRLAEIQNNLVAKLKKLHDNAAMLKASASEGLTSGLVETNHRFGQQQDAHDRQAESQLANLSKQLESDQRRVAEHIEQLEVGGARRLAIATKKAAQVVGRSRQWCNQQFPRWDELASNEQWPATLARPLIPLGDLSLDGLLPSGTAASEAAAPLLYSPLDDGYLTITGEPGQTGLNELVRNIVLRAMAHLPHGKTEICVIDPPGLGRDFGWLMHLADFDSELVSHRVWTQPQHIAKQIVTLAQHAEDFIQQSLRNQYRDIEEYNRDAGALAEPFRILVWSSFPDGLDDQSWKALQSLMDTGPRCGIIPILIIDQNSAWRNSDQAAVVARRGMHLEIQPVTGELHLKNQIDEARPVQPEEAPTEAVAQKVISGVGRRAMKSSHVEVPLANMVAPPDQWWQADSSKLLEIPVGQSGVGRTHSVKLGLGTAQHAIIAGKTGSGKSSLLHAMITSALVQYSPERLRLVLLDFKKGVEFQVYAEAEVPHADIIGIESHREFGLSALEYIDGCLQRRGEAFRKAGVQDLASWNAIHPDQIMPRMLLVVDEFQELFVEDDKLAQQASLILDRIVRQGRSFGVHAVLSSQTLAGAYSLPRTTLGQMAVRIALQCDANDAQIIFAEDNPAALRLKHPGQAVYNDAGGRIEGNQPMQIGWLAKETQLQWFDSMESGYSNADSTTNRLGRTVVYDGNRAATWDDENARLALKQAVEEVNPDACWCVVGESVAIHPAVVFPLTRQAGRNCLVVGGEDALAASVLNTVVASFTRDANRRLKVRPKLFVVQGSRPTDGHCLALSEQWKNFACEMELADTRNLTGLIEKVHAELTRRIESIDAPESQSGEVELETPILLSLLQLGRLRELRREDEFSFGESELTPDKRLEEILRDGPSHGIHTLIWAESYSTVNRWLSRTAMREIELRLLMQMSGNDSTNLIESVAAAKLGEHVMLVYDEATGTEQKFRPFDNDCLSGLTQWQAPLDE